MQNTIYVPRTRTEKVIATRAEIVALTVGRSAGSLAFDRRSWALAQAVAQLYDMPTEEIEQRLARAHTSRAATILEGRVDQDTWCMGCAQTIEKDGAASFIVQGAIEVHTHPGRCANAIKSALENGSVEIRP